MTDSNNNSGYVIGRTTQSEGVIEFIDLCSSSDSEDYNTDHPGHMSSEFDLTTTNCFCEQGEGKYVNMPLLRSGINVNPLSETSSNILQSKFKKENEQLEKQKGIKRKLESSIQPGHITHLYNEIVQKSKTITIKESKVRETTYTENQKPKEDKIKELKPKKTVKDLLVSIPETAEAQLDVSELQKSNHTDGLNLNSDAINLVVPCSSKTVETDKCQEGSIIPAAYQVTNFRFHLENILTEHYCNMENRLGISTLPDCLNDLQKCNKHHLKDGSDSYRNFASDHFNQMLKDYCRTDQYIPAKDYLLMFVAVRSQCPSVETMLEIFDLILNMKGHMYFSPNVVPFVLKCMEDLFQTVVDSHPPHMYCMRKYYKRLLTNRMRNIAQYDRSQYNIYDGIFVYVLSRLDAELKHSSPDGPIFEQKTLSHIDICQYSIEEITKSLSATHNYNNLNRRERIHRLFILLKMFNNLFKNDLSYWILVCNDHETKMTRSKKPILAHLLWGEATTSGFINAYISKIIKLYVDIVKLQFPQIFQDIASDLLSLVAQTIVLSERNAENVYPKIGVLTTNFVDECCKFLLRENMDSIFRCIRQLKPTFIQYLVCDHLIHKVTETKMVGLQLYIKIISKKLWLRFKEQTQKTPVKNAQEEIIVTLPHLNVEDEDYNFDDEESVWITQFTKNQFLFIVKLAIKGFLDCYRLKDIDVNCVRELTAYLDGSSSVVNEQNYLLPEKQIQNEDSSKCTMNEEDDDVLFVANFNKQLKEKSALNVNKKYKKTNLEYDTFFKYYSQAKLLENLKAEILKLPPGNYFSDLF